MSGDEDVLVDAKLEEVPEREKVHGNSDDEKIPSTPPPTVLEAQNSPRLSDCSADKDNSDTFGQTQDASVRRILEIISDISVSRIFFDSSFPNISLQRPQILPAGQLHCTQCIGDLQEL